MKRAEAIDSLNKAFDDHTALLVKVLCENLAFDPTKAAEYVGNFHRGLENAAKGRDLIFADLESVFPE